MSLPGDVDLDVIACCGNSLNLLNRHEKRLLAIAYENRMAEGSLDGEYDMVTFTSASTVDNFFTKVPNPNGALLASIGPVTSEAIVKHGRKADIEAPAATIEALRDAIVAHERQQGR